MCRDLGNIEIVADFCARITCAMGGRRAAVWHRYEHQVKAVRVGHSVLSESSEGTFITFNDLRIARRSADKKTWVVLASGWKITVVGERNCKSSITKVKVFGSLAARHAK